MHIAEYMRRNQAADYLKQKYGHGSPRTLAKLATVGGGPLFRKIGRLVVYTIDDLDAWAVSKLSELRRSTSDDRAAASLIGKSKARSWTVPGAKADDASETGGA
jgi:hypothetical protein